MSTLLTLDELIALTGTKQKRRMATWLTERQWVFEAARGRSDHPKVDRAYYQARMTGAELQGTARTKPRLDCFGGR